MKNEVEPPSTCCSFGRIMEDLNTGLEAHHHHHLPPDPPLWAHPPQARLQNEPHKPRLELVAAVHGGRRIALDEYC